MQTVPKCFISLILAYNIIKKTALLCCTANQAGTGHKLHFQPKNQARAKLAAINNKKGCGRAEVWWRKAVFFLTLYDIINDMKYLRNYLHHTSAVPQTFLFLIAANLALAGFLGWKWSLWPVPTWLTVQRSKAVFLLILYDSVNDMKHCLTVSITPQPCLIYFSCWLLPIWP